MKNNFIIEGVAFLIRSHFVQLEKFPEFGALRAHSDLLPLPGHHARALKWMLFRHVSGHPELKMLINN